MLDDTDRGLLRHLQADPAQNPSELAHRVGISRAKCARRLDRLVEQGILRGQSARIHWPALGYNVAVSLRVNIEKSVPGAHDAFIAAARKVPEVLEIQTFLGRVDVRLKVVARDMPHYQIVYRDRILSLPHIADIEALMHVTEVKSAGGVPL